MIGSQKIFPFLRNKSQEPNGFLSTLPLPKPAEYIFNIPIRKVSLSKILFGVKINNDFSLWHHRPP